MLYSDRIRIENAKFTNTFISVKSEDASPGTFSGASFIAKAKKAVRSDRDNERGAGQQALGLDVPSAALALSSLQASSDYRWCFGSQHFRRSFVRL